MSDAGIDRAVLVQSEPYGDDHALVLDSLKAEPELFRATSLFYPRDPDAPEKLARLARKEPGIVATRFHGHGAYLEGFDDPGVGALWKRAAELGLIVELHIGPAYARGASKLVQQYSETKVLVDHLAEPHTGTAVEFADVLALASFPNVYMKLSGLNHFSQDAPLYLETRRFTRWVVDTFGPDRMVWGSGTPQIVDAHMADFSEEERAKVKGGNLAKILGFA
jgi:predicted TIM-barrel fold metal-dependent hydrolase